MSIENSQDKAKNLVVKNGWDNLLIEAHLNLQHYPHWSQTHKGFEEEINIGVKNVSGIQQSLDVSYINNEVEFTKCEFGGICFMIGGSSHSGGSIGGGGGLTAYGVALFIDDIRVLALKYFYYAKEYVAPKDYSLHSVEEFHSNPKINDLLIGLHEAKKAHETKINEKKRRDKEVSYKSKFTFDE